MTPEPVAPPPPAPMVHEVVFPTNLPESDGEPLDSDWHRLAIALLVEMVCYWYRDRRDFFAGGNMFLYFSVEQVRNRDFRGPDFFFVWDTDRFRERPYWAVWEEGGKYPNVIIELLSPSTANVDRTTKKRIYERTFRTPEYFLYDPDTRVLEGWRLSAVNGYEPIEVEEGGRLWSRQLELYVGTWDGPYLENQRTWLRFFDVHGNLVLTGREDQERRADDEKRRADDEKRRADDEKRRADDAEVQTRRAALLELAQARLADPLPEDVRQAIEQTNDPAALHHWFKAALRLDTLAELRTLLQQQP